MKLFKSKVIKEIRDYASKHKCSMEKATQIIFKKYKLTDNGYNKLKR